ncbi:endonuclease/exonuclease/phosphatase family protein [Cyanobacteria bacterium FACHB-63]|nr:endonuclease/exonuclease/phosphatase family protein [Cyanobacteria bacterium FACHB-63]
MTSSVRFRIATWNLERPRQNGWIKNQRQLDRIREIDADIWVLTETNAAIDLKPDYQCDASVPYQGHRAGENLTTLWSRWKILRSIPTFDSTCAICAEIESPFGLMIIYGTVITWANDKGISGTSKKWEEHRRSLQYHHEDWLRIQKQHPEHLMCIAGDFNQSRDGSGWYEDKQSVEMLSGALHELSLDCMTGQKFQGLSRSTVDHICLSQSLLPYKVKVGAWEGTTPEGTRMSDHNGVFIDLRHD